MSSSMMYVLSTPSDLPPNLSAASTHDDVIASWDTALTYKAPKVTSVSLQQWLNMWGRLTYCAAGLGDFPIWVQMLPNIFFDVIDLDSEW